MKRVASEVELNGFVVTEFMELALPESLGSTTFAWSCAARQQVFRGESWPTRAKPIVHEICCLAGSQAIALVELLALRAPAGDGAGHGVCKLSLASSLAKMNSAATCGTIALP